MATTNRSLQQETISSNYLLDSATNPNEEDLANHMIKWLNMDEEPETTLLTVNGQKLFASGTINLIFGKTGTGKSSLTHAIAATLVRQDKYLPDLGLRNEFGRDIAVLWVDTELFKNEFVRARKKILTMAMRKSDDFCLLPLRMQSVPTASRIETLASAVRWLTCGPAKPHVVVIADTITDLIDNFNDVDQTDKLTQKLLELVDQFNCTFVCVMHAVNQKAIGHLGSSLQRKSSSIVRIERRNESITIKNDKNRNGKEFENISVEFGDGPFLKRVAGTTTAVTTGVTIPKKRGRPVRFSDAELIEARNQLIEANLGTDDSVRAQLAVRFMCGAKTIKKRLNRLNFSEIDSSRPFMDINP